MLKNTDKNPRALKTHRWDRAKTVGLVTCAMLTALGVVLGGLLSIPAMPLGSYSLKIGFGALTDFIQAMIFPKGAYMPWFTIVGMLFGLIPGLFFMKKQEPKFIRILLAVAVGQIVSSVICNTILIAWLYGLPLWQTMLARAINQAVMIPLYSIITYGCIRLMKKAGITRV